MGLSVKIRKGEFVGIVGASGSGKSTLKDIILGLVEPDSGRLMVDGEDVFENIKGWQKKCGFVPQQIFLLDDTVRRNVAFSLEDGDIDDSRVIRALTMAQLDTFIDNLPKIYGIYTGGFLALIILMSIAESAGMSAKLIGIFFVAFTVGIYALIGYLSRTLQ